MFRLSVNMCVYLGVLNGFDGYEYCIKFGA